MHSRGPCQGFCAVLRPFLGALGQTDIAHGLLEEKESQKEGPSMGHLVRPWPIWGAQRRCSFGRLEGGRGRGVRGRKPCTPSFLSWSRIIHYVHLSGCAHLPLAPAEDGGSETQHHPSVVCLLWWGRAASLGVFLLWNWRSPCFRCLLL